MTPRPHCPRCDGPQTDAEIDAGKCETCGIVWDHDNFLVAEGPPEANAADKVIEGLQEFSDALKCERCEQMRKLLEDVFDSADENVYPHVYIPNETFRSFKQRWEDVK
ncbi:MAG TPA: hypothetical protein VNA25_20270 [Phycisphaerae bacterium]|nr:hypothetical protein [Phycisphaerae bacterium]